MPCEGRSGAERAGAAARTAPGRGLRLCAAPLARYRLSAPGARGPRLKGLPASSLRDARSCQGVLGGPARQFRLLSFLLLLLRGAPAWHTMATGRAALGLLLLGAVGALPQKQNLCTPSFYHNESSGRCCYHCPPDQVPQKSCPQGPQDCRKKCNPDYYLEDKQKAHCLACVSCSEGDLVETIPCTWNTPRVCKCQDGMFCATLARYTCARCVKHSLCPPEARVKHQGTSEKDTVCEPCPPGTFSNYSSSGKDCLPKPRIRNITEPSNTTAGWSLTQDTETVSPSLTGRPNPGSEPLFWVMTIFAVMLGLVVFLVCQQKACRKGILQSYSPRKNCQQPRSLPRKAKVTEKQGLMSSRPAPETAKSLMSFCKESVGPDLNAAENLGPGDISEPRPIPEHTNNQIENIYIMKADTVIVGSVARVSEGRNPTTTLEIEEKTLETDQSTHYPEQETELSPGGHIDVMFSVEEEGKEYWPTAVSAK
ncbi:tumor necrosis factor receptor superfamily member 8 isoform X1 [Sarcophilus harrisii]|uniref:tumor necrosis factor receptor superfamily member 8 isoform X1 n=1 Tax=Sarcophilus harrisii TaxID=9305 RepID=UPI001301F7CD|nr:tumor necrosis factor receptor superfamily member 8 isoform X1 [Sarcophilus harrisii]